MWSHLAPLSHSFLTRRAGLGFAFTGETQLFLSILLTSPCTAPPGGAHPAHPSQQLWVVLHPQCDVSSGCQCVPLQGLSSNKRQQDSWIFSPPMSRLPGQGSSRKKVEPQNHPALPHQHLWAPTLPDCPSNTWKRVAA